ncbi:MAG TPA: hypothetical protein VMP01_10940 [Pirellulaceae bacterium]|nr:hypothetical protein [Pirellulaceae bacterium]
MADSELLKRANLYAVSQSLTIKDSLGFGTDGVIWSTNVSSAIKVFSRAKNYATELESYRRLHDAGITDLAGFAVPELYGSDDDLLVIEMSLVKPPYVLDFGKVYLDRPPDFSADVMNDWYAAQKELWGDLWPTVRSILSRLQGLGIYHMDPKPGNIMPEHWDPEL